MAVANEEALRLAEFELKLAGIPTILFLEPDLGNSATALATPALPKQLRKHFRKYPMWGKAPKDII